MSDLEQLENKLKIHFTNKLLLEQAFVHRSYLNENEFSPGHNERLEFLGDAVLEMIVTKYLYQKLPDKSEGELTALRSALVRRETLAEIASELDFHNYLKLSRGEAKTAANQPAILANTVEAFIGALFLDAGITAARKFLSKHLLPKLDAIIAAHRHIDAKSHFQELVQEREGLTPTYQVAKESGPDHDKTFEVIVLIGGKEVARGTGNSKQAAEMDAATTALAEYPH
ncbi:ribonuclease III [candidate division Kazan bacterium RBG_13_50_9]|uniref:Ribonuclease 3 n=1 Tax=candidate division Kazan bacterium RBG_13_50_9 TaxID=1798535 RepID=A0A1F4NRG9_UNCK3|nr:MAG: ribonuclease III [candidate division Kazan bacterium RBG_13_50_9]